LGGQRHFFRDIARNCRAPFILDRNIDAFMVRDFYMNHLAPFGLAYTRGILDDNYVKDVISHVERNTNDTIELITLFQITNVHRVTFKFDLPS
jgi:hypothetical protein